MTAEKSPIRPRQTTVLLGYEGIKAGRERPLAHGARFAAEYSR